jgi:hypothetical protein
MDLIEEYNNRSLVANTEIYKLHEFYSDITDIPSEKIYRAFPHDIKPLNKKKNMLLNIFKLSISCYPYFIIKFEYI